MKTKKLLAILCCVMLMASLTGCFPFSLLKNILQDSNGGSDGPTSIIVQNSEYHEFEDAEDYEDEFDDNAHDDFNIQVNVGSNSGSGTNSDDYNFEGYDDDENVDIEEDDEDVQRVGSVKCGYVDVPADYTPYVDSNSNGEEILLYSDASGLNIVTLSYMDENTIDAETLAYGLMNNFYDDAEIDQSSITGAKVEIDDTDAYQIYGYYPDDDVFLVIWVLDSPYDDYIHYVAVEFTSDNYALFTMVEDSYHVTY